MELHTPIGIEPGAGVLVYYDWSAGVAGSVLLRPEARAAAEAEVIIEVSPGEEIAPVADEPQMPGRLLSGVQPTADFECALGSMRSVGGEVTPAIFCRDWIGDDASACLRIASPDRERVFAAECSVGEARQWIAARPPWERWNVIVSDVGAGVDVGPEWAFGVCSLGKAWSYEEHRPHPNDSMDWPSWPGELLGGVDRDAVLSAWKASVAGRGVKRAALSALVDPWMVFYDERWLPADLDVFYIGMARTGSRCTIGDLRSFYSRVYSGTEPCAIIASDGSWRLFVNDCAEMSREILGNVPALPEPIARLVERQAP